MINQRVLWVTAFASLLPGWAVSDPPIPFGGWSVNNGVVTAGCASTAQCSTPTVMPGLYQRELTGKADGRQYVQNIMTDSGANGLPGTLPFSSESFVLQGGFSSQFTSQQQVNGESNSSSNVTSNSGISVRQEVNDPANGFVSNVTLNTGAASTPGQPSIEINQQLLPVAANLGVAGTFSYLANIDPNGTRTGFKLFIDQTVDGTNFSGGSGGWGGNRGSTDSNVFAYREVAGTMLTSAGTASFSGGGGGRGGWGGTGSFGSSSSSGSVAWKPGDDVKVVWVAQPSFGFQMYDNLTDTKAAIAATSISGPGPFSWFTDPFGPKPTLPKGSGGGGNGGWGWKFSCHDLHVRRFLRTSFFSHPLDIQRNAVITDATSAPRRGVDAERI